MARCRRTSCASGRRAEEPNSPVYRKTGEAVCLALTRAQHNLAPGHD